MGESIGVKLVVYSRGVGVRKRRVLGIIVGLGFVYLDGWWICREIGNNRRRIRLRRKVRFRFGRVRLGEG